MKEKDWTEKDLEDSLRRFFTRHGSEERKMMDGHEARNQYLREGVELGLDKGWLRNAGDGGDEQWTEFYYELTTKGKKYFGTT
jgi:hypothetical protein